MESSSSMREMVFSFVSQGTLVEDIGLLSLRRAQVGEEEAQRKREVVVRWLPLPPPSEGEDHGI